MWEHLLVTGDGWETSPDEDEVSDDARGAPVWTPEVPSELEAIVALWLLIFPILKIVGGPELPPQLYKNSIDPE